MLERKEFIYEDGNLKLAAIELEEQKFIVDHINDMESPAEKIHFLLKQISIPLHEDYDFQRYSSEEFEKIVEEPHLYGNMETILNEATIVLGEIMYRNTQRLLIELKQQKVEVSAMLVNHEINEVSEFIKELNSMVKEDEVNRRVDRVRRINDLYPKPIPMISENTKRKLEEGLFGNGKKNN